MCYTKTFSTFVKNNNFKLKKEEMDKKLGEEIVIPGMSKRTHIALELMKSMITSGGVNYSDSEKVAKYAFIFADAFLNEENKTEIDEATGRRIENNVTEING